MTNCSIEPYAFKCFVNSQRRRVVSSSNRLMIYLCSLMLMPPRSEPPVEKPGDPDARILIEETRPAGANTQERHVAAQHVDDLRYLGDPSIADKLPRPSDG